MSIISKIRIVFKGILIHMGIAFLVMSILMLFSISFLPAVFGVATNPYHNPLVFGLGILVLGAWLLVGITFLMGMVLTVRYVSQHIEDTPNTKSLYSLLSALLYFIILILLINLLANLFSSRIQFPTISG